MGIYEQIQQLPTGTIDELAELFADLYAARSATATAREDARLRDGADWKAEYHGGQADSLTEDLAVALGAAFPELRQPLTVVDTKAVA